MDWPIIAFIVFITLLVAWAFYGLSQIPKSERGEGHLLWWLFWKRK